MMRNVWTTAKRELVSEAASPAAWVFLVIFLVTASFCAFVASGMFASGQADLSPFFDWMPWLFLLLVPALAMPMWSEERRMGVFELTLSFPVSLPELVLGKFLAGTILLAAALVLTFPVPVTAMVLGKPDTGAILCGYAGALMLGMVYLAIASLCSAVSRSQTASFLLSMLLCGFFLLLGWPPLTDFASEWLPLRAVSMMSSWAFLPNYQAFQKGVADSSEIVYAFSLSWMFLFLTCGVLAFVTAGNGSFFAPGAFRNRGMRRSFFRLAGNILFALILCGALNRIAGTWKFRIDASSDSAYSIASATEEIARTVSRTVYLRFYASTSDPAMNQPLRKYAKRVEWLLQEFVSASGGRIRLDIIDPKMDSPEEEAALLEGLKPVTDPAGNRIYLGLSASHGEKCASVPVLSPRNESMLEYEIARITLAAARDTLPKIGVMSAFSVLGRTPDLSVRGRITGELPVIDPPWFSLSELKKDFELVPVPLDTAEIPDDLRALLIIHPSGISKSALYAVDRYVTGGGNLAAFLDPRSYYAVLKSRKDYSYVEKLDSDLGPLPAAWGVIWNRDLLAVDMVTAYRKYLPGRMITLPGVMNLTPEQISRTEENVSLLNALTLYFPGSFDLQKRDGVDAKVLFTTSPESQIVSSHLADRTDQIIRGFRPSGIKIPLAVSLSGCMASAYPRGPEDRSWLKPGQEHRKKGVKPARIVLFADSDMLFNDVCVRPEQGILGNREFMRANDNITLLQNVMESLAGERNLSAVRGRIPMSRPLTKINELKAAAELHYRDRILAIERDFASASAKLNALKRSGKDPEEIRKESRHLASIVQDTRRELAVLRSNLKTDLDRLENRIRFINLIGVPALTALAGILWSFLRRKRGREQGKEARS